MSEIDELINEYIRKLRPCEVAFNRLLSATPHHPECNCKRCPTAEQYNAALLAFLPFKDDFKRTEIVKEKYTEEELNLFKEWSTFLIIFYKKLKSAGEAPLYFFKRWKLKSVLTKKYAEDIWELRALNSGLVCERINHYWRKVG